MMSYIQKFTNKLLDTNTYLYIQNDKCILIDPGSEFLDIMSFIQKNKLTLLAIFATHGHFDHVASVTRFQENFKCHFYLHNKDAKTLKLSNFLMKIFGYKNQIEIPIVDNYFEGNEGVINIQDFNINYFNFPGHTSGSCIFKINNNIFTGDTLLHSLDISKVPNENLEDLKISQKCIFEKFDENLNVCPGHGNIAILKEIKDFFKLNIK